jgi:hypothetical protein
MPTNGGPPRPVQVLVPDDGRAITSRWTGPATLEVVVPHAARAELFDSATGVAVAATAVSAAGPGTLHGSVTVVVRTAAAADDADAAARARAAALLDDAWKRLPHGPGSHREAVIAPDRAYAATDVDGDVWLIDLGDGAVTTVPVGDAYDVALTADRLLVSRASGAFEVRDRASRAVVASIPGAAPAGGGLVTTPDGSLAARLRRDGTIEVVDIARAGVLGVLGAPSQTRYGMLSGLAFTADGGSLAVAYPDQPGRPGSGELDVYDLAPDRLVQAACATAGRDLTAAEWRQFVNDAIPDDLRCAR